MRLYSIPKNEFSIADIRCARLVADAGSGDVVVSLTARVGSFASAEAMLRIIMAGTPLGTAMENAGAGILQTVIDDVNAGVSKYLDDRGLLIPVQGWVVGEDLV